MDSRVHADSLGVKNSEIFNLLWAFFSSHIKIFLTVSFLWKHETSCMWILVNSNHLANMYGRWVTFFVWGLKYSLFEIERRAKFNFSAHPVVSIVASTEHSSTGDTNYQNHTYKIIPILNTFLSLNSNFNINSGAVGKALIWSFMSLLWL